MIMSYKTYSPVTLYWCYNMGGVYQGVGAKPPRSRVLSGISAIITCSMFNEHLAIKATPKYKKNRT